jgi:hypothetical protein
MRCRAVPPSGEPDFCDPRERSACGDGPLQPVVPLVQGHLTLSWRNHPGDMDLSWRSGRRESGQHRR